VAAAAELLGISQHTLRRWADAGLVPCRRAPSGQRQFRRVELESMLAEQDRVRRGSVEVPAHAGDNGDGSRDSVPAILKVSRAVARTDDVQQALDQMARELAEAAGVSACLLHEFDAAQDVVVLRASHEAEPDRRDARAPRASRRASPRPASPGPPRPPLPAERALLLSGEALVEVACDASATLCASLVEPEWATRLCVPFGVGQKVNGYLELRERCGERRISSAARALARDFGDLAALAIHREQTEWRINAQSAGVASLLSAGRAIASSLVLEEVLDTVARQAVATLDSFYCDIWEYLPHEDCLVERAAYQVGDSYVADGDVILLSERPWERVILNSPGPVLETLSDPDLNPDTRASMERWGEKTCLSLPLCFGEEKLGVLVLGENERERRFSAEELQVAQGLAVQASAAVHNARLYRDLQSRNDELLGRERRERLLNELSLELSSSLDMRTILESAAQRISALLDASGCDIYSCEEDALVCLASCQSGGLWDDWVGMRFPLEAWHSSRRAIAEGVTLAITSLDDPRLSEGERTLMREWDERALLVTPMKARGRILGTIEIVRAGRERVFTAEEIVTAEACARMTALALDNATLFQRQADHAQRLSSLLDAGRAITSSLVIADVLDALARTAAQALASPEALIFEYDGDADTMTMRSIFQARPTVYEDIDKPYPLSEYPSDRELMESGVIVVETISDPTLPADVRDSMGEHGEKTCLSVPLRYGSERLGVLVLVETEAERVFTTSELEFASGLGEQAAMAMHNARLFESVKRLHVGNLRALSSALTAKDYYTVGHTARVAAYAVLLAGELGWGQRAIQQLEEATYLHDIGKIAVADRVLLKTGALTEDEWKLMTQHPVISAEIIESLLDEEYVAAVRHHHERYDGSGYPDGLAGEQIPLVARLLCVVDSYDAMSSRRVYRPALTYKECLVELRDCSGTQFDPGMAEAFVRVLEKLNSQRLALQAAADEAAARIDAADHLSIRGPADREGPEHARILTILRETQRAHPLAETLVTEGPVDEYRCAILVDVDEDPESCIEVGEVAFSDDLEIETFASRRLDANVVYVDSWGTWLFAAAPIRDDDAVVGLVCAGRSPVAGLSPTAAGSAVGDTFADIMRTAAARQTRAEIESRTDALTGLYNHRRFQECLREEVHAALSSQRQLALLFCDIDNFKLLNDRLGHQVGDDVLRRVGHVLAGSIRRGDVAARYGGDEFAVLLFDADPRRALEVAERIHQRVGELSIGPGGEGMSISIGVATLPADSAGGEGLLACADRAMYAAKDAGRDRIVYAGGVVAGG
jgi:diguanylate cyclase (GGDEF)-like protein